MLVIDHGFLDSLSLDSATKGEQFCRLLRALPVGLSEWTVHRGLDTVELRAIQLDGVYKRQSNFDVFGTRELLAMSAAVGCGVFV